MATRILTPEQYAKHQEKYAHVSVNLSSNPAQNIPAKAKRSKYGNVKTVVDGVKLDSKREAKRYRELGLLLKAAEIDFLARQVRFRLPGGVEYVADFVYGRNVMMHAEGVVVEDAKGHRTQEFINKKKQMKAMHAIDVVEV